MYTIIKVIEIRSLLYKACLIFIDNNLVTPNFSINQ